MADRLRSPSPDDGLAIDVSALDQKVTDLANRAARQRGEGRRLSRDLDADASTTAGPTGPPGTAAGDPAASPIEAVAALLTGLRDDVQSMRSAFLELPALDEVDERLAAVETRLAEVEIGERSTQARLAEVLARLDQLLAQR